MDANATNRLAEQIHAATEAMRKLGNRQTVPLTVDEAIHAMTQVLVQCPYWNSGRTNPSMAIESAGVTDLCSSWPVPVTGQQRYRSIWIATPLENVGELHATLDTFVLT